MTTSCCTAYTEAVAKHLPELAPFVSTTRTPMHYTAELASARFPDAVRIFIGPCAAKRKEALGDPLVDYVLTFEELGSMFVAGDVDVADSTPQPPDIDATVAGRGFPVSGGVARAVQLVMDQDCDVSIRPEFVNGITKQELKRLKDYTSACPNCNLVEVMSCEGGCVSGTGVIGNPKSAARKVLELGAHKGK